MQTTIADRRIAYESRGEGRPLLLLHAFPFDRTMYRDQMEGLADAARVIAFDAPGVGASEPGPVSMDGLADLAAALLDTLRIDRAVVGGVSMGGYASFAFARRHPDRLSGLILANTRPAADTEQAREGRREMAALAEREGSAAIAEKMLPKVLGETLLKRNKKLVARVRGVMAGVPAATIIELLGALAGRADSTELLPRIEVPTLVIGSEEDGITTLSETREWAARIPNARLVELNGVGHLSNMEAPERFNEAVRELLAAQPSA